MKLRQFPAAKKSIPECRCSIKVNLINLPRTKNLVTKFNKTGLPILQVWKCMTDFGTNLSLPSLLLIAESFSLCQTKQTKSFIVSPGKTEHLFYHVKQHNIHIWELILVQLVGGVGEHPQCPSSSSLQHELECIFLT
jgi:hypothetical protein